MAQSIPDPLSISEPEDENLEYLRRLNNDVQRRCYYSSMTPLRADCFEDIQTKFRYESLQLECRLRDWSRIVLSNCFVRTNPPTRCLPGHPHRSDIWCCLQSDMLYFPDYPGHPGFKCDMDVHISLVIWEITLSPQENTLICKPFLVLVLSVRLRIYVNKSINPVAFRLPG